MNLLIYNNTSRFSTVLNAFLEEINDGFDNIYVVFPKKFDVHKEYGDLGGNVKYIMPSATDKYKAMFVALFLMFSPTSFSDFSAAKKKGKRNRSFFVTYYKTLVTSVLLFGLSKNVFKTSAPENTSVFSTWYAANAIAASTARKKGKCCTALSYAHSYEVDFRKNNFTAVIRDNYKSRYLDEIYFISENVMNEYEQLNKDILKNTEKFKSAHFGSRKKEDGLCKPSDDGVFRILTCSGMGAVKRLDLLAEALLLYKGDKKINWTHLGDGEQMNKIKDIISGIGNENVTVELKGKVTNDDVHRYYVTNPVDLFVNVSKSEGLPVSIMECMSYGVPCLATDVGGNHEIVTEKTGYPVGENITADELCGYLTDIVKSQSECREKRGAAFDMWNDSYRIDKNVKFIEKKLREA